MKRFSLVIVILLTAQFIFAQNASTSVSNKEAMTYGLNYMKSQYPTRAAMNVSSYELLKSEVTGKDCYHVFNFEEGGFVIVCADRRGTPILGYSDEGSFDFENGAPATQEWIKHYMHQLDEIEAKNIEISDVNVAAWNVRATRSNVRGVEALVQTKWNQSYPYNMLCPEHSQGDHGHTYTGCVATAMAQVMKYWNYPQSGTGKVSYFWGAWDTIDLSKTTYDWANMPNVYSAFGANSWSDEQKQAVATLMLHCGVSINMSYGYDGSGTQTEYTADALRYNFGYRNGVTARYRDNGGTTDETFEHYFENDTIWSRMLIEDLDMHRPLIYSGHPSSGAGHAWVCDGYRTNSEGTTEFHMNWGWGGANDGYYTIDNLNTHASAGDDGSNNFVYGQCVVFNIAVPDLDAAPYCMSETNVYEEEHWNVNDGSYSNFYKNNTNCDWVIKIKDYQTDTLLYYFNYFELEAGDELKIYAGENANGQLLATYYDGNEPVDSIKHVGTPIYIQFTTDGENQARGWELHYEAMRYPFTVTTSIVGNGGSVNPEGVRPVMKNSTLSVVMTPENGYSVSEFTIDGVLTLKGAGMGEAVTYTFTNIKSSHEVEVKFGPVSVDTENANSISIYPNPNNGKFSMSLENDAKSYILYDINGRVVEEKAIDGQSVVDFDIENMAAGTYFIKVITGNNVSIEKIVVE